MVGALSQQKIDTERTTITSYSLCRTEARTTVRLLDYSSNIRRTHVRTNAG